MLPSPNTRLSRRSRLGNTVAHGLAPSQPNMLETIQTLQMDDALLSVMQVAHLLNVSRLTIYRLIERGVLPVYRIARRLRFAKSDLHAYLTKSRTHIDYGRTQN
jgi:excisionase family DNA binding protein